MELEKLSDGFYKYAAPAALKITLTQKPTIATLWA
jgi:hypothetical protein